MSNEASKIKPSILGLLRGKILDIGCGDDKITPEAEAYDKEQGDAQTCSNLQPDSYDTIFSSHCLEHLERPKEALDVWWKLLKVGGFMIIVVPDEDLYEQGVWPSTFNSDHKASFTPSKTTSWSPVSLNVIDLIKDLPNHKLFSLKIRDDDYIYSGDRYDRTHGHAQAHIEIILQKVPPAVAGIVSSPAITESVVTYV